MFSDVYQSSAIDTITTLKAPILTIEDVLSYETNDRDMYEEMPIKTDCGEIVGHL